MHISQYFLRGDVRGAIAHMRAHEEFRDVLPAYLAIFENCEYRAYEISKKLNDILRLYQIYFRDVFYCGMPEAEAADRLRTPVVLDGKRQYASGAVRQYAVLDGVPEQHAVGTTRDVAGVQLRPAHRPTPDLARTR